MQFTNLLWLNWRENAIVIPGDPINNAIQPPTNNVIGCYRNFQPLMLFIVLTIQPLTHLLTIQPSNIIGTIQPTTQASNPRTLKPLGCPLPWTMSRPPRQTAAAAPQDMRSVLITGKIANRELHMGVSQNQRMRIFTMYSNQSTTYSNKSRCRCLRIVRY